MTQEYRQQVLWASARGNPWKEVYVIIGNGFDIDCGLPTSYSEFLDFARLLLFPRDNFSPEEIQEQIDRYEYPLAESLKPLLKKAAADQVFLDHAEKLRSLLGNNFWYQYFTKTDTALEKGWVDFEAAISKVIRIFEHEMTLHYDRGVTMDDLVRVRGNGECLYLMESLYPEAEWESIGEGCFEYNVTLQAVKQRMHKDLNHLIEALEFYLREYVERIELKPVSASVEEILNQLAGADKARVVSFNYTHTLERLMEGKATKGPVEYCYVHGKIREDGMKNTMVLGIDEHLDPQRSNQYLYFAPFRKYNQRVYKGTSSKYMDWLDDLKEDLSSAQRRLLIFGHSLGMTDKDILEGFITGQGVHTVCYYHNEDAFCQRVENMTGIIGMDELIRRTGGAKRSLRFREQKRQAGSSH